MFHGASCHALHIVGKLSMSMGALTWFEIIVEKLSMSMGALTWFEIVWSYDVEAIDY